MSIIDSFGQGLDNLNGWLSQHVVGNIPIIGPALEEAGNIQGAQQGAPAAQQALATETTTGLRTNVQTVSAPGANLQFLPWVVGYSVFALVILASQDSDDFAGLGTAFAWLVFGGAILTRYKIVAPGIANLTGVTTL